MRYRTFVTLLPLKELNYSWTRPHCENPRTQGQGWSTLLGHRNQDKPHYEGKRSGCTLTTLPHTASPPHQCSTTKRGVPWVWVLSAGKESPGRTSSSPILWVDSWESWLWSHPRGTTGKSAGLTTGNLTVMEKGKGFQQLALRFSQNRFLSAAPNLKCQPGAFSSAEPSLKHSLTRELREAQVCLI